MSKSKNNPRQSVALKSASVTDRGLNPRRPLNEDCFLVNAGRGIFAVADGVGGAEAGEVASQTAIQTLEEAFRQHTEGADIEDLMELAIQRANALIHQMAQENPKFSMMATTIVGLHLEGGRATIGHVGDSRLYRLTPAGQLLRETDDHSVVEEEVRAGRMTAEQAAKHPGKNVISRALGAEKLVEVDMKVIEVDSGTEFLLCTDGITRHVPDQELRQLLIAHDDLAAACAELKKRCFERGAEDNLTAVVVSVGTPISVQQRYEDAERTISPETRPLPAGGTLLDGSHTFMASSPDAPAQVTPLAFPEPAAPEVSPDRTLETRLNIAAPPNPKSAGERTMTRWFLFVFFVCAVAGAFYAGRRYRGPIPYLDQGQQPIEAASPAPGSPADPRLQFEQAKSEVDANPKAWLASKVTDVTRQNLQSSSASFDREFAYLYGRASLLAGHYGEAGRVFEALITQMDRNPSPEGATLRNEAVLGLAAVALKLESVNPAAQKHFEDGIRIPASPLSSPLNSPSISP